MILEGKPYFVAIQHGLIIQESCILKPPNDDPRMNTNGFGEDRDLRRGREIFKFGFSVFRYQKMSRPGVGFIFLN